MQPAAQPGHDPPGAPPRPAMPGLVLRAAHAGDAGVLLGHMLAALREAQPPAASPPRRPAAMERWLQRQLAGARHLAVVAEVNGAAVGSVGVLLDDGPGRWLLHLFVEPGFRATPLARHLLERAENPVLIRRMRHLLTTGRSDVPLLSAIVNMARPPQALLRLG